MKKRLISMLLMLAMALGLMPVFGVPAYAATAPTEMWVDPPNSDDPNAAPNNIPVRINVFARNKGSNNRPDYVYELYLPGDAVLENCFLSWNGDMEARVNGETYQSGSCPIPPVNDGTEWTYTFGTEKFKMKAYQGSKSENVQRVFIEVDEINGPTIYDMDHDKKHNTTCTGTININGTWYIMPKIKGRGNATWEFADDKRPYNVTIENDKGKKINFPGIDSAKTKKWSFLAEVTDHSLMSNRAGFWLAHELGIGQDTTSADVWMNGEYQGCYTVTPKTDSFVTDGGYMIEQDNYLEDIDKGGDPQFRLDGLDEPGGWSSGYNRITVKKMGDDLLGYDENDEVNETVVNLKHVAYDIIQPWLQEAWDAIRSSNGYNNDGKYYTDYIDIESFAKMYLMHEYVKSYDVCAGSILFHRDGMTDADKLIAGPVWDLDNAMGSTCTNSDLDNKKTWYVDEGDLSSGEGDFISIINEYKTSIYKTIYQHEDFQKEVLRQYNKYKEAFDALPERVAQMKNEIADSARMNHYKVNEISGSKWKNTHKYNGDKTVGSGEYVQHYTATTDSKTDWPNYADNLITYITTRSLWFKNTYTCTDHQYEAVVTEPTCTEQGMTKQVCSICGFCDENLSNPIPALGHDLIYHEGQEATDTKPGWKAYDTCSRCDYTTYEEIPADLAQYGPFPVFSGQRIILSGQIGMIVSMKIENPEYASGTMEFTVGTGDSARSYTAKGVAEADNSYKFTCPVTSVEMAETITARYTYDVTTEEGVKTETETAAVSVKNYLDYLITHQEESEAYKEAVPLAKAIYNYGHYAMIVLPGGSAHQEMVSPYTEEVPTIDELTNYPVSATLDYTAVSSAEYSLNLDSETAINIYLKTTGIPLSKENVTVEADSTETTFKYTVKKDDSGEDVYRVKITGIAAHELGSTFEVTVKIGDAVSTIRASALSYVQQNINNPNAEVNLKYLAKALYSYYVETMNYREK